ncbi:AraC family transcriptional regulator [Streptomyces xiamenensis]|uniref:AraC family transcriptional regulator n=1 Tax=Streptomyces xiamenensis TaxID=408015 RepID=UPI0035E03A02
MSTTPTGAPEQDWVRYWRDPERPLEAMRAHFTRHVFHRHSHDAYSFAVTESGAQRFRCRGAEHTSSAGMVMAFNPDDPHDGRTAAELGFTYRIMHLHPSVVREVLADAGGGTERGLPLFDRPVRHAPALYRALLGLHHALVAGAGTLVREERLSSVVTALVREAATARPRIATARAGTDAARRARTLLDDSWQRDIGADELARAAGCSRYALYRAFRAAYGMPPSDYQRLLRLRAARRLLATGTPPAEAAATCGFADQPHLTRWFTRVYGITPATYRAAAG